MPRATDIMPITEFTRAYQKVIRELKKHGQPTVLTVDGKPSIVVQDARAYQETLDTLDALYLEEAVQRALDDPRPSISVEELRRRLGLSKKSPTKSKAETRKRRAA
jgi:PHD/YefM family antitoxin component YafN of YafNO toxin-antitoxin module